VTPLPAKASICPKCGAERSAEIVYGLPAFTKDLQQALEDGRVVLGGCLVDPAQPRWLCRSCGEKHGGAAPGAAAR
jgi:hypothetical protein